MFNHFNGLAFKGLTCKRLEICENVLAKRIFRELSDSYQFVAPFKSYVATHVLLQFADIIRTFSFPDTLVRNLLEEAFVLLKFNLLIKTVDK